MSTQQAVVIEPAGDIEQMRIQAQGCRNCPLYANATQAVFGEGVSRGLMLIGEQPGDHEDIEGRPFVGPAGQLLDRALVETGIPRDEVYITNAVKHFKWEPRGKRRIHQRPTTREIRACLPWLEAEIRAIEPRVVVCLGAVAAEAIFGPKFRLTHNRGMALEAPSVPLVYASIHPSAVLRNRDSVSRDEAFAGLVRDLSLAREALGAR